MTILSGIESAVEDELPALEVVGLELLEAIGRKVLGGDELHKLYAFLGRVREGIDAHNGAELEAEDYPADPGPVDPSTPIEPADTVPAGSAAKVLGWVDGDPARAQQALEAENGRDKPRTELTADLERIAAGS